MDHTELEILKASGHRETADEATRQTDRVATGFPSPAEDMRDGGLDLNQYLIHHPAATYFMRVKGDTLATVGILNNDILVVDRSQKPSVGRMVVIEVNGGFEVGNWPTRPEAKPQVSSLFSQKESSQTPELYVWGVVSGVIRKL